MADAERKPGAVESAARSLSPFRTQPKEKKSRHAKAGEAKRKKSLAANISVLYGMAGGAVSMTASYRAGRLMQIQAPQAGKEIDQWVRSHDTLYSFVEPFLGAEGFSVISKVAGPPLLVYMLERRPELVPMFRPLLMPMLYDIFREFKREEAKLREVMEELTEGKTEEAEEEFVAFLDSLGFGLAGQGPPPESPYQQAPGGEANSGGNPTGGDQGTPPEPDSTVGGIPFGDEYASGPPTAAQEQP